MGELKVDVPGVTEDDLDIKIDDDGRLTIEGQRMVSSETSRYTSKFSKTFSLDKTVDVDKFTASLNNGVLVVSAPKDLAKLEENIRKIPITSPMIADADADADARTSVRADADSHVTKLEEKALNNDILTAKDDDTDKQQEKGAEDKNVDEVSPDNNTLDLDVPNAE